MTEKNSEAMVEDRAAMSIEGNDSLVELSDSLDNLKISSKHPDEKRGEKECLIERGPTGGIPTKTNGYASVTTTGPQTLFDDATRNGNRRSYMETKLQPFKFLKPGATQPNLTTAYQQPFQPDLNDTFQGQLFDLNSGFTCSQQQQSGNNSQDVNHLLYNSQSNQTDGSLALTQKCQGINESKIGLNNGQSDPSNNVLHENMSLGSFDFSQDVIEGVNIVDKLLDEMEGETKNERHNTVILRKQIDDNVNKGLKRRSDDCDFYSGGSPSDQKVPDSSLPVAPPPVESFFESSNNQQKLGDNMPADLNDIELDHLGETLADLNDIEGGNIAELISTTQGPTVSLTGGTETLMQPSTSQMSSSAQPAHGLQTTFSNFSQLASNATFAGQTPHGFPSTSFVPVQNQSDKFSAYAALSQSVPFSQPQMTTPFTTIPRFPQHGGTMAASAGSFHPGTNNRNLGSSGGLNYPAIPAINTMITTNETKYCFPQSGSCSQNFACLQNENGSFQQNVRFSQNVNGSIQKNVQQFPQNDNYSFQQNGRCPQEKNGSLCQTGSLIQGGGLPQNHTTTVLAQMAVRERLTQSTGTELPLQNDNRHISDVCSSIPVTPLTSTNIGSALNARFPLTPSSGTNYTQIPSATSTLQVSNNVPNLIAGAIRNPVLIPNPDGTGQIIILPASVVPTSAPSAQPAQRLVPIAPKTTCFATNSTPASEHGTKLSVGRSSQRSKHGSQAHQQRLDAAGRHVASMHPDDLRRVNSDGDMCLHQAIYNGEEYIVYALLKRMCTEGLKSYVDHENNKRRTPLYLATFKNQPRIVEMLVKCDADPNLLAETISTDGTIERKAAIHVAASLGLEYKKTLEELIKAKNLNINLCNNYGQTALHCAVLAHGKPNVDSKEIVKTLIKAGADPCAQERKKGSTPLMHAIDMKKIDMVEAILKSLEPSKVETVLKTQDFDGNSCLKKADTLSGSSGAEIYNRINNLFQKAMNGQL